jgi:DNA-binding HxlR family transcriptional regulator
MPLNATQREQVRLSTLRYCRQADGYGLSENLLLASLRAEGLRSLSKADLQSQLQYLLDKKLIARVEKTISPENASYRITAEGEDFFAQQNPNE